MMAVGNLEYIFLRLARRFILNERIVHRLGRRLPYFQPSVGETSPLPIVDLYWKYCRQADLDPVGKTILEIGAGATNGTAYEISGRGADCLAYDPYAPLDRAKDDEVFYKHTLNRHPNLDREKVLRIASLNDLPESSIDLVLSHSVLEHVRNLDQLLENLKPVIKPDACMLHIVDYRDHFFKYPLHFLQFSTATWYNYLDPGDLSRARIGDHTRAFSSHGFHVEVLARVQDAPALLRIRERIHEEFLVHSWSDLATTWGVLFARRCRIGHSQNPDG
jgi:SAM-dependent methyltransferase